MIFPHFGNSHVGQLIHGRTQETTLCCRLDPGSNSIRACLMWKVCSLLTTKTVIVVGSDYGYIEMLGNLQITWFWFLNLVLIEQKAGSQEMKPKSEVRHSEECDVEP